MNNLVFYDKEGNFLNFNYNDVLERYEGDIIFPENSNDTFKTQAIYLFEKIDAFEYEDVSNLTLSRWQLFNEYGFNFYSSNYSNELILKIEPSNFDSNFSSKWIYGRDFHKKFRIGSQIRFDSSIFEFTNTDKTYTVVSSKKDAIMIISSVDNSTFNSLYTWNSYSYTETISSLNIIGIYNYVNSTDLSENLSPWNERDFYNRIYKNRKINIVNTDNNDSYKDTKNYIDANIVTVKNENLIDINYHEYYGSNLPSGFNLNIEVILNTDLPVIYTGHLTFYDNTTTLSVGSSTYSNVVYFYSVVPEILKPGIEFKIPNSVLNQQFFTISDIPSFLGNVNPITYSEGYQVIWNNRIYQCVSEYNWSATSSITPDDSSYWGLPTYLPLNQQPTYEDLPSVDLYLTKNKFNYFQLFTQSSTITLASAAEKFSEDLKALNINLYYDSSIIHADLSYSSQYAVVNFYGYTNSISYTYSYIGGHNLIYERAIEIEETINNETNSDYSANYSYNIFFTDIDDYGIIVKINKQNYQQEFQPVYSSGVIDMERTIDKTLRAWLTNNSASLLSLGIISNLQTIGVVSPYYNSIRLRTEYPNVPLEFKVDVGTTANFFIEKSQVIFYEPSQQSLTISPSYPGASYSLGNFININVNGISYGITHSLPNPSSTIAQTLQKWVDEYSDILDNYGIYVNNLASSLKFNVKNQHQRCDIVIQVGSSVLPGDYNYKIVNKMIGNHGALLTSNEIILATYSVNSLETSGFSTGMITGINGTVYPLQDVEYNILYLSPGVINLSYEGPFWGITNSIISPTASSGGMFDISQFSSAFSVIDGNTSTYSVSDINSIENMVDIVYVQSANSIFVFGETPDDKDIAVYDSVSRNEIGRIYLPLNVDSIKIIFDDVNNYLWALSKNILWQVDPFSNVVVNKITISEDAFSLGYDKNNGYVYVTTDQDIKIFNPSGLIATISTISYFGSYNLIFHESEGDMYVSCRDGSSLLRIDGTTLSITSIYVIAGLTSDDMVYDNFSQSIYLWGTNLTKIKNGVISTILISSSSFNNIIFNSIQPGINISNSSPQFSLLNNSTDTYSYNHSFGSIWGYQEINMYDGDVYLSNQDPTLPGIWVFDGYTGNITEIIVLPIGNPTTQLIFNPDRNSIWAIQPNQNSIVEVVPIVDFSFYSITPTYSYMEENNYGSLSEDYIHRDYLWIHTKDFIRRPRYNYVGYPEASLYWKWFSDNVPEFFMYDFSGDLLPTTGVLSYVGPKPLTTVHLNRNANRNIEKVSDPEYQQTIFPIIGHRLNYLDDGDDTSSVPDPIETFVGFNSQMEGGIRSILQLYLKEEIDFSISTLLDSTNIISFETVIDSNGRYGLISLDLLSSSNFITDDSGNYRGLKPGQELAIFIKDETNSRKQYISNNNGYLVKIREVFFKSIKVDFFKDVDRFDSEKTIVLDYPKSGNTTYLSVRFKVWDKEIGRFNLYGQTEIEDIRFETELGNIGKLISSDDVYIFKEYDIKEEGIDWTYLNRKRKEMLMMKNLIYPYIGSYKSIINAINYFGYNDLELNEYYRNINYLSPNYRKLFKVEIPDIFDNSVEGWTDNDFIKHVFPNENYEDTNLFNLTYRITDKEGNNLLTYSLEEVQKKLQGLKYWLQKNIIPITHKILDITGRADFVGYNSISHIVRDATIIKVRENFTPVSFKLNELYLMPINNGSTVYNCVLDFYLASTQSIPDTYEISIRTYEIYREWYPFKNYMIGDRVIYYDKLYESVTDNNQTNNPRKYEDIQNWSYGTLYNISDIVKYDRDFYVYSGYGSVTYSTVAPFIDSGGSFSNWINITEWREIDLVPIQKITERRFIDNLYPFNFSIDSNIDPYLVIEVTSENGYGATYRDKKNYEIRGILDIRELESYTNLTSKKYIDSVISTVRP